MCYTIPVVFQVEGATATSSTLLVSAFHLGGWLNWLRTGLHFPTSAAPTLPPNPRSRSSAQVPLPVPPTHGALDPAQLANQANDQDAAVNTDAKVEAIDSTQQEMAAHRGSHNESTVVASSEQQIDSGNSDREKETVLQASKSHTGTGSVQACMHLCLKRIYPI